jgi:hypothetical protein
MIATIRGFRVVNQKGNAGEDDLLAKELIANEK